MKPKRNMSVSSTHNVTSIVAITSEVIIKTTTMTARVEVAKVIIAFSLKTKYYSMS